MSINVIIIIHDYRGMIVGGEACWTKKYPRESVPSCLTNILCHHHLQGWCLAAWPTLFVTITLLILSHLWPLGLGVGLGVGVGL